MAKNNRIDFLFSYEHKARELESLLLIKYELNKRGYSVRLYSSYENNFSVILPIKQWKPKVVVVPALYSSNELYHFCTQLVGFSTRKIANLQWEQVLSQEEENDVTCYHNPKGFITNAVHFCWGEKIKQRIVNAGVPKSKAIVTGNVNLDFLRPECEDFYFSKHTLAKEFNIPENKDWNLFISSFALCDCNDSTLELVRKVYGKEHTDRKVKLFCNSRNILLDWFECVLAKYPERILIYRPHPDEINKVNKLNDLTSRFSNFRIISSYSLKHWVKVSSIIYNWYSTSMIDIHLLRKPYHILRPLKIDPNIDVSYMVNMPKITDYEDFENSYIKNDFKSIEENQVDINNILNDYYDNDIAGVSAHEKVADILEKMLLTSKYDLKFPLKYILRSYFALFKRLVLIQSYKFRKYLWFLLPMFKKKWDIHSKQIKEINDGYSRSVPSYNEIVLINQKIDKIFKSNE